MMIESKTFRHTPYFLNFIFNGNMFVMQHRFQVPAGGIAALQAKTGPNKIVHIFQRYMVADGGGPYSVSLIEDPVEIIDGTLITTVNNMNRRSTKVSEMQFFGNPPNFQGGIIIDEDLIPTGSTGGIRGAAAYSIGEIERILKENTNYIIRIRNNGTEAGQFQFNLLYYETDN